MEGPLKLVAVRWSRKDRPVLVYAHPTGARVLHRVGRYGTLTMLEAFRALGLNNNVRLYRMKARGELKTVKVKGRACVRVSELRRLRRMFSREAA